MKRGEPGALGFLGYRADLPVRAELGLASDRLRVGEELSFTVTLEAESAGAALVDYRLRFHRPRGSAEKVFKLGAGDLTPGVPLHLGKRHRLKGNATTFTLHPGPHAVIVQVNGRDVAEAGFELLPA